MILKLDKQARLLLFFPLLLLMVLKGSAQQLPIKPARNITFTVREGSYMNISCSPDGKMLAFDLLGDIYLLPIKGGKAVQFTRGIALHINPIWSPDGKSIAYQSDSTGTMKTHIHNLKNGYVEIREKTNKDPFGRSPIKAGMLQMIASPDGKWGAWVQAKQRRDRNTGAKQGRTSLYLKNIHTGEEKVLVQFLCVQDTSTSYMQNFSFSPGSEAIYIAYGGKIHRVSVTGRDEVVPFEAKPNVARGQMAYHKIKLEYGDFSARYIRNANISPNGGKMVFSAMNRIYLMDIPGGTPKVIADQEMNQYQPSWSADGKWIAYVSWNDREGGMLWKVHVDGGPPKKISNMAGQYQNPCFSPDGKWIAVVKGEPKLGFRDDSGWGELLLIGSEGGNEIVLDKDAQLWNKLTFSPDGASVSYVPFILGSKPQKNILLAKQILVDSTKVLITDKQQRPRHLTSCSISADGKYLVYSQADDVFLLKVGDRDRSAELFENGLPKAALRFAAGVDPYWSKDGRTVNWVFANELRSADITLLSKLIPDTGIITKIVNPDRAIAVKLQVPALLGKGTLAVNNARIITMGSAGVIEKGTLLARDGRIIAIGKTGEITLPKGTKVIEAAGKTIMPGLIDLHCHMGNPSNVFPQQSWMLLANLAYGVTTARDPSQSYDSFGYVELLRSGQMGGPRLVTVGRAIRMEGGAYDGSLVMDNLSDAQHVIDKRKQMGGISIKQYMLKDRIQRQWTLIASDKASLNMTNEGGHDFLGQLAMIKDGSPGIEHNPEWGDVYEDVIQLYAKSGTYLTPTLQVGYGQEQAKEYFKYKYWRGIDAKLERFTYSNPNQKRAEPTLNGPETLETIRMSVPRDTINPPFLSAARIDYKIFKGGGKIGVGSHGNNEGIGTHNEIWALQMGGMGNMEALRAATLVGAEALGLQQDIGSLEVGKIADLLILDKNPLEDIHNTREIRYVMKDGVLYDGNTLETLWPMKGKAPVWK